MDSYELSLLACRFVEESTRRARHLVGEFMS